MVFPDIPPYAGGDYLLSTDGDVSWTDDSTNSVYFKEYGDKVVAPRDVFISGYLTRYYKTQVVGYHGTSGDLRSIAVTASGEVKTIAASGLHVVADIAESGMHVIVQSGIFPASGIGVIIPEGIQVSGTVQISGSCSISGSVVSISGNTINIGSILRTTPLVLVTAASGGEVLGSGDIINIKIKNMSGNKDIFIGTSGVTHYPYSGYGFCLGGDETVDFKLKTMDAVFACANNSGERISVIGTQL